MKTKIGFRLFLTISLVIYLVSNPLTYSEAHALTSNATPLSVALVTLQGIVRFEGLTQHSNIVVQLKTSPDQLIGTAITDSGGNYSFGNVDTSFDYTISAAATFIGYSSASISVKSTELPPGGIFVVTDLLLVYPHKFTLDWVFQPDGSPNFDIGLPASGSITLTSESKYWRNGVRIANLVNYRFCFATVSTADCYDFFVANSHQFPSGLWATIGLGGIHDMGAIPLASLTQAPDKNNGVGPGLFYNNQYTEAIIGNTYAIVTSDGNHYAKIHINAIQDVIYSWNYLPITYK